MLLQMALFCSFLWLSNIPLYICTTSSLSIPVDGHLGCFHVLTIVSSAAVNTGVHVSFQIMVFSRYMPRSGTAGSYGEKLVLSRVPGGHWLQRLWVSLDLDVQGMGSRTSFSFFPSLSSATVCARFFLSRFSPCVDRDDHQHL